MKQSIYEYISSSLKDGKLPDDFSLSEFTKSDGIVFADGALDGITMYHMPAFDMKEEDYQVMVEAVNAINDHEFEIADGLFQQLEKENRALLIANQLQDYIINHEDTIKSGNVYEYGVGTIQLSNHIECVKYALMMLELLVIKNEETKKLIRTLALSDEFTLYCVHIMTHWVNGNEEIFEIAKNVHGWGRIHAVEFLKPLLPRYDEIREWMLKEGINNDVMPSYSALTCWKNANIGSILFVNPTAEEFKYIGKIIDAMLDEDAIPGISTLDKRKEILLKYLEKAEGFTLTIDDYLVIYHIYQYAKEKDIAEVREQAMRILETANAKTIILSAVKNGKAIDLATEIGIDCKPYVFIQMRNAFLDNYYLCKYLADNESYRKQMYGLFKNNLPLNEMITMPTTALGFEAKYENERALEYLLEVLRKYPLEGIEFVLTGLQCEPIRTRNAALTVLENWVKSLKQPLSVRLPDIQEQLIKLSELEVEESVKEKMNALVNGESKKEETPKQMLSEDTLNILSDAISDVGCWTWWLTNTNLVQLEFAAVQLYDDTKKEKEAHSSTIALCFSDNTFFTVLDDYTDDTNKDWYKKLQDDEIDFFEVDGYEFEFNNKEYVKQVMDEYKNKTVIKGDFDESIYSRNYFVAAKCGDVAFIAGGDDLDIVTHHGGLTEEQIKQANRKWWEYWKDYWRVRNTKEAYEKDFACEVCIPVHTDESDT